MGNRKLRQEVISLMKAAGITGPLYKGTKLSAYKGLRASALRVLKHKLQFKPGDLANDCNGYNRRISKWLVERYGWSSRRSAVVLHLDQFEDTTGAWSCGCPSGPWPAKTPQEIEAFFVAFKEYAGEWWTEDHQARYDKILRGEAITDSYGIRLEEKT